MRTIPKEVLKIYIPESAKWIAQDKDGWWKYFNKKPNVGVSRIQWVWSTGGWGLLKQTNPPENFRKMLFTIEEFNKFKKELK